MGVDRFEDLAAWRHAEALKLLIYDLCRRPAIARDYHFRDQIREAAASAPSNIAEGFARFTHPDFARFARIGKSSEVEVLNHLRDAKDRGYISAEELPTYEHAARRAIKAVNGLIRYLERTPNFKPT